MQCFSYDPNLLNNIFQNRHHASKFHKNNSCTLFSRSTKRMRRVSAYIRELLYSPFVLLTMLVKRSSSHLTYMRWLPKCGYRMNIIAHSTVNRTDYYQFSTNLGLIVNIFEESYATG